MAQFTLRPEFRTAGGEVNDLEMDGIYAGTVTLTYRENDRLVGSVQLDKSMITKEEKEEVALWADEYVHSLADALHVEECEVLVTYSKIDHIISSFEEVPDNEINVDLFDDAFEDTLDDSSLDDIIDPNERDEYTMYDDEEVKPIRFELVIVGEDDNRIEYHIYGKRRAWLAEAIFVIDESDVFGEVNWMVKPSEDEIEAAADLIVSDFDEEEIDSFLIEMKHEGITLESIELTHEDMLAFEDRWANNEAADDEAYRQTVGHAEKEDRKNKKHSKHEEREVLKKRGKHGKQVKDEIRAGSRQFAARLIRDDVDALTYDIYERKQGGLPIGRATVNTSERCLTGFVELHEPTRSRDREIVATTLLRELEKDNDYESLNLTMLHQNKPIEDIFFENDTLH